jgi:TolA-binding protein
LLRSQKITLTPTDGFVLSRIDGTLSAREVMGLIPLPAEDVERSLFSLLCTGIVGYGEPAAAETTGRRVPRAVPSPAVAEASPRRESVQGTPQVPAATPTARAPMAPPAPPMAPPGPSMASPAPATTPETARVRALLEASRRPQRDPFEVLDIEPTTDEATIRQAYTRLARVLHPDVALDTSLEHLQPLRSAAFVQLGAAYEALRSSLDRRQAFEKAQRARGHSTTVPTASASAPARAETPASAPGDAANAAPEEPRVEPAAVIRTASRHFEKERYWDAIQLLEPLLQQCDGPMRVQAQMLLAKAYLKNPKWTKRAEETLLEVLHALPRYAPALLLLGDIYRTSGLVARARSAYQKVLAIQPDNEPAAQALAELEPPPEPEPPRPTGLRGIFKKR